MTFSKKKFDFAKKTKISAKKSNIENFSKKTH